MLNWIREEIPVTRGMYLTLIAVLFLDVVSSLIERFL